MDFLKASRPVTWNSCLMPKQFCKCVPAPNVLDVEPISQQLADHCHANLQLDDEGFIGFDIVGIKGHGVVAIDVTPWRAYEHIERLEHICKIVLASGKNSK